MTTSVMDHHGEAAIQNPILRGFNPDPSITRVGDDYYVATSTFEWYPGVQIHHSRDLRNWRLLTRPLRRASQLDMRGDPDSCGVWAPCLRHYDGLFYLIYTDVKRYGRPSAGAAVGTSLRDMHNYLVTSPTIDGEWSDPVHVNSSGFDPSLFRDDDGRQAKSAVTIPRPGRSRSGARQAAAVAPVRHRGGRRHCLVQRVRPAAGCAGALRSNHRKVPELADPIGRRPCRYHSAHAPDP